MTTDPIEYGDPVEVRDANGVWIPAVARSEPLPWPATDVRPYVHDEGGTR